MSVQERQLADRANAELLQGMRQALLDLLNEVLAQRHAELLAKQQQLCRVSHK
jgi:hypothetical protein